MPKRRKCPVIVMRPVNEMGRYWFPEEFKQVITKGFRDHYDPRRLVIALMSCAGIRMMDACRARFSWFSRDFRRMRMGQCKAKRNFKLGYLRIKETARDVPVPEWLAVDLQNYCAYRLMVGRYVGENLEDFELFPKLHKHSISACFQKMRLRLSHEMPFLLDIWQWEIGYDLQGNEIYKIPHYRIAPHAGRAVYATRAWEVADGDIVKAMKLSGHDREKNFLAYQRVFDLEEKKKMICRLSEADCPEQRTPVMVGQRSLREF